MIRRAAYGLKESPRLWQEERDRVLEGMTSLEEQYVLGSIQDASKHVAHYERQETLEGSQTGST
eukprot:749590-Prorocentrum_lima.AAC.1